MSRQPTVNPQQQELPFALLEVHGRTTLTVKEVADRLACTRQHVCTLVQTGELGAINIGTGKQRMAAKIPVECFRDFVIRSMTCKWEQSPLRHLPTQALVNLYIKLGNHLRNKGVSIK